MGWDSIISLLNKTKLESSSSSLASRQSPLTMISSMSSDVRLIVKNDKKEINK